MIIMAVMEGKVHAVPLSVWDIDRETKKKMSEKMYYCRCRGLSTEPVCFSLRSHMDIKLHNLARIHTCTRTHATLSVERGFAQMSLECC